MRTLQKLGIYLLFLFLFIPFNIYSQNPKLLWTRTYGQKFDGDAWNIIQTLDGGYIMCGWCDNKFSKNSELLEYILIIKINVSGTVEWQKYLGGSSNEACSYRIIQTKDKGYLISGFSWPDKRTQTKYAITLNDIYVIKLNPEGEIEWQKLIGGSDTDYGISCVETKNGSFFIIGYTYSKDRDIQFNHGGADYLVIKLDKYGNILWEKTYGGSGHDLAQSGALTKDGGLLITGYSYSNDGDVTGHHGSQATADYWIVKIDSMGSMQWQKSLGGDGEDEAYWGIPTKDGGYIITGQSNSTNADITKNNGQYDIWVVKLDHFGKILWQKTYGGKRNEKSNCILQTYSGDYIIAGISYSGFIDKKDKDVDKHYGSATESDCWIIKINQKGDMIWQQTVGGSKDDNVYSIAQCLDGDYIFAGSTTSNDYDIDKNFIDCSGSINQNRKTNHLSDFFIFKISDSPVENENKPNFRHHDNAFAIDTTPAGNYIITGYASSDDGDVTDHNGNDAIADCWSFKINKDGNLIWSKSIGGKDRDWGSSIKAINENVFTIIGNTFSIDGDIKNHYGTNETCDGFIISIDSKTNKLLYQKNLGGDKNDMLFSSVKTNDNSIVSVGLSESCNGELNNNYGLTDYWVIKTDKKGKVKWSKNYGGSGYDIAFSIDNTLDKGFIIAGTSNSNEKDLNVLQVFGGYDFWIIKIDSIGKILWSNTYGGSGNDIPKSIIHCKKGGYICVGETNSNDGEVSKNYGSYDCWVIKIDDNGKLEWEKSFGGTYTDCGQSIYQTYDGGYVVGGWSRSNDGTVTGHHGIPGEPANIELGDEIADMWIIKIDSLGNMQWQKSLGGTGGEHAFSILQTPDKNFIVVGGSASSDGDVQGHHGILYGDDWVVKLNSKGEIIWSKCYWGSK